MVFNLNEVLKKPRKKISPEVLERYSKHYTSVIEERLNYKCAPENTAAFSTFTAYIAHWRAAEEGLCDHPERGLFIFGDPGTGKTTAMQFFSAFCSVDMISTDELAKAFSLKSAEGFWTLADEYRFRPLIVDDLGCEENTRSFGNQLPMADFIRERERQWQKSQLLTFFTSNASSRDELIRRYGKNVCSRLLGMCEFINFKGPDHRLTR